LAAGSARPSGYGRPRIHARVAAPSDSHLACWSQRCPVRRVGALRRSAARSNGAARTVAKWAGPVRSPPPSGRDRRRHRLVRLVVRSAICGCGAAARRKICVRDCNDGNAVHSAADEAPHDGKLTSMISLCQEKKRLSRDALLNRGSTQQKAMKQDQEMLEAMQAKVIDATPSPHGPTASPGTRRLFSRMQRRIP
jgi:hypothetical protein